MVNLIDKMQYDVTLVTLLSGGVNEKRLCQSVKYLPIVKCKYHFIRKILAYFLYKVIPASLFHRLFLHGDYDIEIAYLPGIPTYIIQHSTNKSSKKVCFIHGDVSKGKLLLEQYKTMQRCFMLYKKIDQVCFVSAQNRTDFISTVGDTGNLCILHNVVNVEEIIQNAKARDVDLYDNTFINIISLGRLAEQKGYMRLLEVIHLLRSECSRFRLYIIGCGEQKDILDAYIKGHNLDNVFMMGYQENPYPFIVKADLLVCSSIWEGYSTAVSEATLLGVPVLTTKCAGMNEILSSESGGLIVENSTEGLYKGLQVLITDKQEYLRMKMHAIDYSIKYRTKLNDNIDSYYRLFRLVLNK